MSAVSAGPRIARRLTGPTALGDDRARFVRLTWTLAVTQFRLKFYGSVLGYLWQLMRPLMLFGVLYLVFSQVARITGGAQFYPVLLLTGIVLFTFISEAIGSSVNSLVEREALLRKVQFPRMAVPCSVVLTACMNLGLNLIVVVFFSFLTGVDLHLSLLQVPVLLALLAAFALGIALLSSALFVRYRDVQPISDVVLQVLFYGSPVIVPLEVLPENLRGWILLNPFAAIIQQVRHAAIDPSVPSAFAIGGWRVYVALGIIVALLIGGYLTFRRRAPYVAEDL